MVKVPSEPITSGELVSGIVGTIDISSLISEVLTTNTDLALADPIYKAMFDGLDSSVSSGITNLMKLLTKDGSLIFNYAKSQLPATLKYVLQQTRNSLVQSATGAKITSALFGQDAKFYSTFNFISLLNKIVYDIPSSLVAEETLRYFNKTYGLEPLPEPYALIQVNLGKMSSDAYITQMQEENGFNKADATAFLKTRQNQVGVPSLRDAWSMVQKGLLKTDAYDRIAKYGLGFTQEMADTIYNDFFYDMAPNEIMRLSDFASLDSDWIEQKLKANGIAEADRAIFKTAIERRPLRDEISREYSIILDNYTWGLQSETDFRAKLASWKFSQAEIDLRVESANLLEGKLRLKLLRDAEIYLYRKDVLDEATLLDRLKALNIGFDIANALVRNEASKKGIDWEIEV